MERQLIQSYDNFDLVGVYVNDKLLYKETVPKPLPTFSENNRKIQSMLKPIEVTELEKNDGKSTRYYKKARDGAERLTPERRKLVVDALKNSHRTQTSICKEFKMSLKTLQKIIKSIGETNCNLVPVNYGTSKYVVEGTGMGLRQYCETHDVNYFTVIDRLRRNKCTKSLIPYPIVERIKK